MKRSTIIILAAIVLLFGWGYLSYNGFVTSSEAVDGSWAQVETQYQRRVDLVPNLVATVKGAAQFEQDTLTAVTAARTQWMESSGRSERVAAANGMEGALSKLLLTVESYPQLQATQAFRDLMTQLEGTENRIAVARKDYNEQVQSYNVKVKRFPAMILAKLFGFPPAEFFDAAAGAENAPTVEF